MAQWLYKLGGPERWDGRDWTMILVEDSEVESKSSEGFYLTPGAAIEAGEKPAEPVKEPTDRELLEAEATRLGKKFDGRTSDKKLAELIKG